MSEFILADGGFHLGITEKVPMPKEGECFLLYQDGAGKDNSKVINHGIKYSSIEIRRGKYNKKAVISLQPRNVHHNQKMILENENFYFDVSVKLLCSLVDVRAFFFVDDCPGEEEIHGIIRAAIKSFDGEWNIGQSYRAQSRLEECLINKLNSYSGMKFKSEISVVPDKDAAKMVQSDRDTEVGIHVNKNETDEKISKNQQTIRVMDSEHEIKEKQLQEMALMMANFGIMGPVVNEYLQGNMTGTDLYEHIMKAKANDINVLTTTAKGEFLTDKEIVEKLNEIIADTKYLPVGAEKNMLDNRIEKREMEEKEVEESSSAESISLSDGDYL